MIDSLILYSLSIYFAFHVIARSDIMSQPRAVFERVAPSWLVYVSKCAFCFTSWVGLAAAVCGSLWVGTVVVPMYLLAGPVVNLLVDLAVRALIRANEPPSVTVGTFTGTRWSDEMSPNLKVWTSKDPYNPDSTTTGSSSKD